MKDEPFPKMLNICGDLRDCSDSSTTVWNLVFWVCTAEIQSLKNSSHEPERIFRFIFLHFSSIFYLEREKPFGQ